MSLNEAGTVAGAARMTLETVTHLDSFLAASVRFCEGAPDDRLFNSASAKQDTGFEHIDVFELPEDAVLPFPGKPCLHGDLALPPATSNKLQRHIASRWQYLAGGHMYKLRGGPGVGKTVLLTALAGNGFATLPGRDLFLHDEDTGVFLAILRSERALLALAQAGVAPAAGQTHVVRQLTLCGAPALSRAKHEQAVRRAFPTFGAGESIYCYNPGATAEDGSSQPFASIGVTIAAGSLNALSRDFKNVATAVHVNDAAPEVFVEQAAAVLTCARKVFSLKLLALLYIMWGPSLRAALEPYANSPDALLPLAEAAGTPALAAAPTAAHSAALANLRDRFVGHAPMGCVLRPTVLRGLRDEQDLLALILGPLAAFAATVFTRVANAQGAGITIVDGVALEGAGAPAVETMRAVVEAAAPPAPHPLLARIDALLALWHAAHDATVSREAFVERWRALLPAQHVPPPAFLTHPPAWVDAETGGIRD